MRQSSYALLTVLALITALGAGPADAQSDPVSPSIVSGTVDLRAVAGDGETAWLDGGFGKLRFGDRVAPVAVEASVAWRLRLADGLSATVVAAAQDGADPVVDISQAFAAWRGAPGPVRVSGRAGLFWPTVSLEHDGPIWTVSDTITPSAVNSWIGEEGKVVGIEATVRGDPTTLPVAATVGVFGYGDTAGTLLAFRGWALHDLKSTATGVMPLPPLSPYMQVRQPPFSTSMLELDGRPGVYGRLEWRPHRDLKLQLFGSDNRGDRTSVNADREWAWDTRFVDVGVDWRVDARTRIRAQALAGVTLMGRNNPALDEIWVHVDFGAAYAAVTRDWGPGAATARLDLFRTVDHTLLALDDNDEEGHAVTLAYRWDAAPRVHMLFELVNADSERPARILAGSQPHQVQTGVQTALRLDF